MSEVGTLADALAKAQGEFPRILKDKEANAGKYTYAYADLADVIDGIKVALSKYSIAYTQPTRIRDGALVLVTKLMHPSGQELEAEWPLPARGTAQEMGAALTYARRYSLCSILGVAAEIDNDGDDTKKKPAKKSDAEAVSPFEVVTMDGDLKAFSKASAYLIALESMFDAAADKAAFWESNGGHFGGWHAKYIKAEHKAVPEFDRIYRKVTNELKEKAA